MTNRGWFSSNKPTQCSGEASMHNGVPGTSWERFPNDEPGPRIVDRVRYTVVNLQEIDPS